MYNNLTSLIFEFFSVYDRDMLKTIVTITSFLFFFFFLFAGTSFAQTFTTVPEPQFIDDYKTTVKVTFSPETMNSIGENEIYVCLERDLCINDKDIRKGILDGDPTARSVARNGLDNKQADEPTIMRFTLVGGSIEVCADSSSKLRAVGTEGSHEHWKGQNGNYWKDHAPSEKGKGKVGCLNGRDYFHPGKIYVLTLYEKIGKDNPLYSLVDIAGFYINYGAPVITVSKEKGGKILPGKGPNGLIPVIPGDKLVIKIEARAKVDVSTIYNEQGKIIMSFFRKLQGQLPVNQLPVNLRGHGQSDLNSNKAKEQEKLRNNYQIVIKGKGIAAGRWDPKDYVKFIPSNGEACVTLSRDKNAHMGTVTLPTNITLQESDQPYIIEVKEQVREFYSDVGADEGPICQGGYVYFRMACSVTSDLSKSYCSNGIYDPNGENIGKIPDLLEALGYRSTRLPCIIGGEGKRLPDDPLDCKTLDTAIGKIGLKPLDFINNIFSYVLSIAFIAALGLIIYGGYYYMISRGDPERIKHAREILTAAIIGLLFIIFSFVILQVIAGDILRIPEFDVPAKTNTGVDRVDDGTGSAGEIPPGGF